MKLSRFPVLVDSVPIEQAKGAIAGLLNLGDEKSCSEGVERPRWNKNAISRSRIKNVQTFLGRPCRNGIGQLLKANTRKKSSIEFCTRFGVDDIPSFRFPTIRDRHLGPVRIVGVDLNAEDALAIEILQEEGKALVRGRITQNILRKGFEEFSKRFPLKRSFGDDRFRLAVVDNLPTLGPSPILVPFFPELLD